MPRIVVITATLALAFLCSSDAYGGWFKKATGVSTPEPIRKIAPNGIQGPAMRNPLQRAPEEGSYFGTMTYSIDPDGAIRVTTDRGSRLTGERAELRYDSQGLASYHHSGSVNSPRRVPSLDRVQPPATNYQPYGPPATSYQPSYHPGPNYQPTAFPPQQMTPEEQVAIGILQIIEAATRNQ